MALHHSSLSLIRLSPPSARSPLRDWSLTTGRGGLQNGRGGATKREGGDVKLYPYEQGGRKKF